MKGIGEAFGVPVQIVKKLKIRSASINIKIDLINFGNTLINGLYACELNFSLLGGHTDDRYYLINGKKPQHYYLDSASIERQVNTISVVNEYDGFVVDTKFLEDIDLWRHPVFTVSGSEAGFEKIYQSSVVLPNWKINLKPGEKKQIEFKIVIGEL